MQNNANNSTNSTNPDNRCVRKLLDFSGTFAEVITMFYHLAVLTLALTLTACATNEVSSKHRLLIMGSFRTVTCYVGQIDCTYWNAGAMQTIRRDAAPFSAPHYSLRPSE